MPATWSCAPQERLEDGSRSGPPSSPCRRIAPYPARQYRSWPHATNPHPMTGFWHASSAHANLGGAAGAVQTILDQPNRLLVIIDASSTSRRRGWRPSVEPVPYVAAPLARATSILRAAGPHNGPTLRCELAPDLPPACASTGPLRQVLVNLLGNAVKFNSAEGFGTLAIGRTASPDGRVPHFAFRATGSQTAGIAGGRFPPFTSRPSLTVVRRQPPADHLDRLVTDGWPADGPSTARVGTNSWSGPPRSPPRPTRPEPSGAPGCSRRRSRPARDGPRPAAPSGTSSRAGAEDTPPVQQRIAHQLLRSACSRTRRRWPPGRTASSRLLRLC